MSKMKERKNKEQVKLSKKKIKHRAWWALGVGIIGTIVWLAVTAPRVSALEYESTTGVHYHTHLMIKINGEEIPIPKNIGAVAGAGFNPIHTHETDNIIHMEFEDATHQRVKKDDIRLGKFFDVWGKDFSSMSLMGNKVESGHTLTMKVNGVVSTEYEHYLMRDKDQIELIYQ